MTASTARIYDIAECEGCGQDFIKADECAWFCTPCFVRHQQESEEAA